MSLENNSYMRGVDIAVKMGLHLHVANILSRRSEEHTSELQSQSNLVCRLLLEKKKQVSYRAVRAEPGERLQRRWRGMGGWLPASRVPRLPYQLRVRA